LFEINEQKNEYFKIMKKVKAIYYLVEEGHYGLKMILEFEDIEYLYFDSCKLLFKKNEKSNLITSKWTKLEYPELEKDDIYIKEYLNKNQKYTHLSIYQLYFRSRKS